MSCVRQTVKQVSAEKGDRVLGLKQLPICQQGRHVKRQEPNASKDSESLKMEKINSGSLWEGGRHKTKPQEV